MDCRLSDTNSLTKATLVFFQQGLYKKNKEEISKHENSI